MFFFSSSLRNSLGSFSNGGLKSFSRYYASSSGCLDNLKGCFRSPSVVAKGENAKRVLQYSGNLGMNLSLLAAKDHVSAPYALSFQSLIHSAGQKNFEMGSNSKPTDMSAGQKPTGFSAGQNNFEMRRNGRPTDSSAGQNNFEMGRNARPLDFSAGRNNFEMGRNPRPMDFSAGRKDLEMGRNSRSMDFVRGIIEQDGSQLSRHAVGQNPDIVLIQLKRNNTFVTVMDSKGHRKTAMTEGWLQEIQGGTKLSRYSAEATAEHVGRQAREMGLKSFVVRVNGFTHFKKKRQAIMSFREGFSQSQSGDNPIVYIEDTTRRAHNGCRLPKKRRI